MLLNQTLQVNIESEIEPLQAVILKRPGRELEKLTPELLETLLFDDIPFLEMAQKEHQYFSETLQQNGVETLFLDDLMADILTSSEIKTRFIREFLAQSGIHHLGIKHALTDYLTELDAYALVNKLMEGVDKNEFFYRDGSLSDQTDRQNPFWLSPMPNLYFARDPAFCCHHLIGLSKMQSLTRQRESLFLRYICREHPRFKTNQTIEAGSLWHSIEGGDVLILNRHVMAIGLSQRTNPHAIETFCDDLFFGHAYQQYHNLKSVLVFHIPEKRAFMHLDTILTQLDNDKFAIHAEAARQMVIYELTPGQIIGKLKCRKLEGSLHYILSHYMGQSVTLINCGGGDQITGSREQWSDAANTLAINPGEVLVYQRNQITNRILEQHGITVHPLPCSELSRGRGGPRCMSMPLVRQAQR